ncbi:MAG: ABC transporter ATP-binding protein [Bacteroidales bacterium]|jgi:peptide/nickel transport system ATP-binding protein|nr:ABC transporter ATP-binding protein [Bacteroidales bacterium]
MSFEKIIEISNLKVSFLRDKTWSEVVHGVDFEVRKGEIVGLVGESGSGKSVTSLSIMGLLPEKYSKINSGNISFYDQKEDKTYNLIDLNEKKYQKIRGNRISMIFQEPMSALNPIQKCGKQVLETILLHNKNISKKEAKQKVLTLFKEVLLPDVERIYNSYPHSLSGGQKQRVIIAMALSCNPSLLIADEPTTALDVTVQKTILELLKTLQAKYNMGILFITHDLGVIKQIAQRVIVLYKGEIVEQGKTEDVFFSPKNPYTKGLIASLPPMDNRPERLITVSDFLENKNTNPKLISSEQRKEMHEKMYSLSPILKVRGLKVQYIISKTILGKIKKDVIAVNDVSFDLFKGETLGLVGESGCGKTTVGRAILQLILSTSGSVEFEGVLLNNLNKKPLRKIRKDIQIIFQDPFSSLNPRLKIGEAIMEPMIVHNLYNNYKERKEKAISLLEKVGLESSHFNRYPHQFSGGQRQRIGIARALALEPKLIICDESVSALDVSVQAQVLNLINDLKKEFNFSCIFISHNLSVVKYMSDRMIVMQKGLILEQGEADEVYLHPKMAYTKKLIEAIPH